MSLVLFPILLLSLAISTAFVGVFRAQHGATINAIRWPHLLRSVSLRTDEISEKFLPSTCTAHYTKQGSYSCSQAKIEASNINRVSHTIRPKRSCTGDKSRDKVWALLFGVRTQNNP